MLATLYEQGLRILFINLYSRVRLLSARSEFVEVQGHSPIVHELRYGIVLIIGRARVF